MKYLFTLPFLALIAVATSAFAQSSGQSARVTMGVVEKAESVTLQNTGESGAVGTVAGAAIGYNTGSGKSSSKKRRHAIIGGAIGGAVGSSGTTPGMQYSVKFADGSSAIVVSDQVQLKVGDCVSVEESRGMTKIGRRRRGMRPGQAGIARRKNDRRGRNRNRQGQDSV